CVLGDLDRRTLQRGKSVERSLGHVEIECGTSRVGAVAPLPGRAPEHWLANDLQRQLQAAQQRTRPPARRNAERAGGKAAGIGDDRHRILVRRPAFHRFAEMQDAPRALTSLDMRPYAVLDLEKAGVRLENGFELFGNAESGESPLQVGPQ